MIKRIFLLPFIAVGLSVEAQSLGNSPYAAFGIGEVKYDNSVETSSMGGINTATFGISTIVLILKTQLQTPI